jgi:hypothetical protein
MSRTVYYSLQNARDCVDHEGRKLAGFKIRTTDGTDELWASRRADSKGSSMTEELIRFSLVSYFVVVDDPSVVSGANVNGQPVKANVNEIQCTHPFESFDKWSTKARNFVVAAWKKLATPDEADLADFFASATEVE